MTIGLQTGMQTGVTTDRRYVYTRRLVGKPVCIPVCKPSPQRTVNVSDHAHYYVISKQCDTYLIYIKKLPF